MNDEKFEFIKWSGAFSCGVKVIDDQHKKLLNMINEMYAHITGSEEADNNYLLNITHETVKYIKTHFATEEKIMIATRYHDFIAHKKVHDSFILTIISIISDISDGRKISLFSFTKFLKNWIYSHITVMDRCYFEHLNRIAAYKNDENLGISKPDFKAAAGA